MDRLLHHLIKLEGEKEHFMKAFIGNGYPHSFICSASAARAPREDSGEREEERPPTVHLPYVAGVSERIRRVCKDFNIRAVFKSGPTLRSLLTKVADPLPTEKQANVVYEVLCTYRKVYIRKTKRRQETCLKEHEDACINGFMEKSAIAKHGWTEVMELISREGSNLHINGTRELALQSRRWLWHTRLQDHHIKIKFSSLGIPRTSPLITSLICTPKSNR